MNIDDVKIILQKCCNNKKTAGIRLEKQKGDWFRTWAFEIDDNKAKNEGFDAEKITGSMLATDEYPGCPYCGNRGFVLCGSCKKLTCYSGAGKNFTCTWCGVSAELEYSNSFELKGGGY